MSTLGDLRQRTRAVALAQANLAEWVIAKMRRSSIFHYETYAFVDEYPAVAGLRKAQRGCVHG